MATVAAAPSKGDVKDLSLAEAGRKRVDWAERDMPVLRAIRERFAKEKPLAGMRMSACLHVTAETANLARTLKAGGADLLLVRLQSAVDPGRRRGQPGQGLRHPGLRHQGRGRAQLLPAHRRRLAARAARHDGRRRRPGQRHDLHRAGPARRRAHRGPRVGRRSSSAGRAARRWSANVVASMEETTTGVIRLRAMEKDGVLKLPVIAVNDAQTKHFFDNRYGTGQSTIDGVIRATDMLLAGRKVVVCGYGWCGKGVALRARGMGVARHRHRGRPDPRPRGRDGRLPGHADRRGRHRRRPVHHRHRRHPRHPRASTSPR